MKPYIYIVPLMMIGASVSFSGQYCWQIKDKDTKALCESRFEGKNNCWLIKNPDKKAYCEAVALGRNICWRIKDHDLKLMCEAEYHARN
jgi:hypothetical protein